MQIQINTGHHVEADPSLTADVEEVIQGALGRFAQRITRVEAHLNDLNGSKGGRDSRCMLEARLAGLQPIAVDVKAESHRDAVRMAASKLTRALESRLGKTRAR